MDFTQLGRVMDTYDTVSEKLSVRITDLRRQLDEVEEKIEEQEGNVLQEEGKLGFDAAVRVFAAETGQIELVLIYGVSIDIFPSTVINQPQLCVWPVGMQGMKSVST